MLTYITYLKIYILILDIFLPYFEHCTFFCPFMRLTEKSQMPPQEPLGLTILPESLCSAQALCRHIAKKSEKGLIFQIIFPL